MITGLERKLLDLKDKIENSKTQKAQLEGRLGSLYERLDSILHCKDVDMASKEIEKLKDSVVQKEKIIEDGIREIELCLKNHYSG